MTNCCGVYMKRSEYKLYNNRNNSVIVIYSNRLNLKNSSDRLVLRRTNDDGATVG